MRKPIPGINEKAYNISVCFAFLSGCGRWEKDNNNERFSMNWKVDSEDEANIPYDAEENEKGKSLISFFLV